MHLDCSVLQDGRIQLQVLFSFLFDDTNMPIQSIFQFIILLRTGMDCQFLLYQRDLENYYITFAGKTFLKYIETTVGNGKGDFGQGLWWIDLFYDYEQRKTLCWTDTGNRK